MNFLKSFDDESAGPWTLLYQKENLLLDYKKGSPINSDFLVGRCRCTLSKSLFKEKISFEILQKYMYDPAKRMLWDLNMKEYKIFESGENYGIFKMWMKSPIFFISERDAIDKRVNFYHDGQYYCLASSVENYSEVNPDVVRCFTYINSLHLTEDEENFYYNSFTQLDPKTIIPEKLLNITIPFKTVEFFTNVVQAINEYELKQQ